MAVERLAYSVIFDVSLGPISCWNITSCTWNGIFSILSNRCFLRILRHILPFISCQMTSQFGIATTMFHCLFKIFCFYWFSIFVSVPFLTAFIVSINVCLIRPPSEAKGRPLVLVRTPTFIRIGNSHFAQIFCTVDWIMFNSRAIYLSNF